MNNDKQTAIGLPLAAAAARQQALASALRGKSQEEEAGYPRGDLELAESLSQCIAAACPNPKIFSPNNLTNSE